MVSLDGNPGEVSPVGDRERLHSLLKDGILSLVFVVDLVLGEGVFSKALSNLSHEHRAHSQAYLLCGAISLLSKVDGSILEFERDSLRPESRGFEGVFVSKIALLIAEDSSLALLEEA